MDERNFVMEKKQEFEKDGIIDISSQSTNYKNKNYKKKKHGIAGFFQRMGEKWKNLKKGKKALIIVLLSLLLVLAITLGVFLSPILSILHNYNKNYNPEISEKPPEELGFENGGTKEYKAASALIFDKICSLGEAEK